MEWIKINDNGEVELVSEEIRLVPEMEVVFTLSYNRGPKDNEGRKRYRLKSELRYMYLAYSHKSPYKDYTEVERIAQAKLDCYFPENWEESKELQLLINRYTIASPNKITRLLHTAERTVDKLRTFLESINLDERNETGNLVHTTASVLKTLSELPSVAQTLTELERQARTDTIQRVGSKGDHQLGWMSESGGKKNGDISGYTKEDPGEI
jgi:hypothetical protein